MSSMSGLETAAACLQTGGRVSVSFGVLSGCPYVNHSTYLFIEAMKKGPTFVALFAACDAGQSWVIRSLTMLRTSSSLMRIWRAVKLTEL